MSSSWWIDRRSPRQVFDNFCMAWSTDEGALCGFEPLLSSVNRFLLIGRTLKNCSTDGALNSVLPSIYIMQSPYLFRGRFSGEDNARAVHMRDDVRS